MSLRSYTLQSCLLHAEAAASHVETLVDEEAGVNAVELIILPPVETATVPVAITKRQPVDLQQIPKTDLNAERQGENVEIPTVRKD